MKSGAVSLKGRGRMAFSRVFVLFPLLLAMSVCAACGETVRYRLFDTKPASDDKTGWEWQSYPLGCGHFGWNVFGIPENERIQVTHNAMVTYRNLTNALEIRIRTGHANPVRYRRELDVNSAVAKTEYSCDGVDYCREYFTSYPARTGVVRLTASKEGALSFDVLAQIPFPVPFGDKDGFGRKGTVESSGNEIRIEQELEFQGIKFSATVKVLCDGKVVPKDGRLQVSGATDATVLFACDTNYEVSPEMFIDGKRKEKMAKRSPAANVGKIMSEAVAKGFGKLKDEHLSDYRSLYGRVKLDLGADPSDSEKKTSELLSLYRRGKRSAYLEELYFRYGRYLLISSSRPGTMPATLQGVWNMHKKSPWGCGYVHNINVQMNYWPAFSCNLAECFEAYAEFNRAFRPASVSTVTNFLARYRLAIPDAEKAKESGMWCVGSTVFPFEVAGGPGGHSGPGMGGLTTKLFKDWWDFTGNRAALSRHIYPVHRGMAAFLSCCVCDYDGKMLSAFSSSPEQLMDGPWHPGHKKFVNTIGCGFDQQLIESNNRDYLELKRAVGAPDDDVSRQVEVQTGKYDPIQIGWSGQIKEFREEGYYGDLGEYRHRHLSHLVALMPGTLITRDTPAWLDAAKVSLDGRGDKSTGWALAHRICAWARTGSGDRAHGLLCGLLAERTYHNLWDSHPPFQIDGNFGAVAGMAEMLLQSHAGAVDMLPALPQAWKNGSFSGLRARGGYSVDCEWRDGAPVRAVVRKDEDALPPKVRFGGVEVPVSSVESSVFVYTGFPKKIARLAPPSEVKVDRSSRMVSWKASPAEGVSYRVLRNTRSEPGYDVLAKGLIGTSFCDRSVDFAAEDYVTYKIVAEDGAGNESEGALHTCSRATAFDKARYIMSVRNLNGIEIDPKDLD